jgi:chromosome segregation ATPase
MQKLSKKSIFTTFCCLFVTISICAQTSDSTAIVVLQQQVDTLQALQAKLKTQQTDFFDRISRANKQIESLQIEIDSAKSMITAVFGNINSLKDSLNVKINKTDANTKIADISDDVDRKSLFGIIGGVILLLLLVGLFLYLLSKRKTDSKKLITLLEEQKSAIETKLVKEYSQQAEVLRNLMKTIREVPVSAADGGKPDHSLALKLADQLTALERSIGLIDEKTKGLQRIKNSLTNLRDNLYANGYELPELLGKQFNQGMNVVVVNTISDENLKSGEEIITRIIKPQVNYQDKMIQAAQIEVSIG